MIYIFSKKDCIFCERAKELLNKNNIKFEETVYDPDDPKYSMHALVLHARFPTMKTFPIITENTRLIGGYDSLLLEISNDKNFGKQVLFG